jgi:ribulose 1,5-bisphosphate carboxylase large subunit-like protein
MVTFYFETMSGIDRKKFANRMGKWQSDHYAYRETNPDVTFEDWILQEYKIIVKYNSFGVIGFTMPDKEATFFALQTGLGLSNQPSGPA